MEISLVAPDSLKIRGKKATIAIDPTDKSHPYNAAILLCTEEIPPHSDDSVIIQGPGEFETGGAKISGSRDGGKLIYSLLIDGIDMLIGTVSALEKAQTKLQESSILILNVDTLQDPTFLSAFSPKAVILYGQKAKEVVNAFGKERVQESLKLTFTFDKLPAEMETFMLQ